VAGAGEVLPATPDIRVVDLGSGLGGLLNFLGQLRRKPLRRHRSRAIALRTRLVKGARQQLRYALRQLLAPRPGRL